MAVSFETTETKLAQRTNDAAALEKQLDAALLEKDAEKRVALLSPLARDATRQLRAQEKYLYNRGNLKAFGLGLLVAAVVVSPLAIPAVVAAAPFLAPAILVTLGIYAGGAALATKTVKDIAKDGLLRSLQGLEEKITLAYNSAIDEKMALQRETKMLTATGVLAKLGLSSSFNSGEPSAQDTAETPQVTGNRARISPSSSH